MYRLIQEYKSRADVVLIDSPPLWYSDALALAPQVDGVLLVVSSGTTGRENTINAVESLRLVGARIIGTVLNRVKAGPAYFYYPTYAANRLALEGTNSVATISAGVAPRSLAAAPRSPEAPALVDQAVEPPAGAHGGGLVSPVAEQPVASPPDSGKGVDPSDAPGSPYATAFIDAIAPDMNAAAHTQADDADLSHAIGEAVAAYSQDSELRGDADSSMMANGHSSSAHRRNRHR
jgi:hypothetical protein